MIKYIETLAHGITTWGFPAIILLLGVIEFSLGLYEKKWNNWNNWNSFNPQKRPKNAKNTVITSRLGVFLTLKRLF